MQNLITMGRIYSIKLENFEGPLDLLCHLIDKNKMDIYDINISEIADQYIDYINKMEELNLEITSEFLIMASTLLYLKSKHLLPKVENEEEEITEEELIRRIIEYKKYKEITKKLKEAFLVNSNRLFKMTEEIELPKQKIQKEYTPNIIPEVYQKLLQTNAEKINENAANIEKIAITETFSVGDKVKDMYRALIKYKKFTFNKLFTLKKCPRDLSIKIIKQNLENSSKEELETLAFFLYNICLEHNWPLEKDNEIDEFYDN